MYVEKDTHKLWQLTKVLKNDQPERRQTAVEVNRELQTGKIGANTFAATCQMDSTVTLSMQRTREVYMTANTANKPQHQLLHVIPHPPG